MKKLTYSGTHYHFLGDRIKPISTPGGLSLDGAGVTLRSVGIDDLDSNTHQTCFCFSGDHGQRWQGPFLFTGLMESAPQIELVSPERIAHVACGVDTCLVFMSARLHGHRNGHNNSFVFETSDGGRTFRFVSWIVPPDDPYPAVLPTATRASDGTIIVALSRRMSDMNNCCVNTYASTDNGKTWIFLSRVGDPISQYAAAPVLGTFRDGRLACAYYVRNHNKLYGRLSADGGKTWDREILFANDDQEDACNNSNSRLPRLVQKSKNKWMAVYDWAAEVRFHQYIIAQLRLTNTENHFREETVRV